MRSNTMRVVLGIAGVVAAIVLLVVLKDDADGGGGKAGKGTIPTIVVRDGKPVGGIAKLSYSEGDRIRFEVDSDVGDEVHVHGYDIAKDVEAGGSVRFDFPATIEGVFEAELESRGEQILELRVNP